MPADKTFRQGEYVFKEGETGGYAYLLESGSVEIVKLTPKGLSVLVTLEKGALFGEMAIIEGGNRFIWLRLDYIEYRWRVVF